MEKIENQTNLRMDNSGGAIAPLRRGMAGSDNAEFKGVARDSRVLLDQNERNRRDALLDRFWIEHGWCEDAAPGCVLNSARWKDDEEAQIEAVRFLCEQVVKKAPRDITAEDFHQNRLGGLLYGHYDNSPFKAISEAYPELQIKEWEMAKTSKDFWREKEHRIGAVVWLVDKVKKPSRSITAEDFHKNGLDGLLTHYHHSSPYEILLEANLVNGADEQYMRGVGHMRSLKDRLR